MKCLVCRNDMIVVEYRAIELDYCLNCRGVWFDSGELELLLDTVKLTAAGFSRESILMSLEAGSIEKKRRCPTCGRKMKKSTLGQEPKVLIDVCPRGEGLWFDGGEIEQLVTQLMAKTATPSDFQGRILSFLGEVFQARD